MSAPYIHESVHREIVERLRRERDQAIARADNLAAENARWRSAAEISQQSADAIAKQLARVTEAGDARGLKTTLREVLASFDADTDGTQSANVTQAEFEAWAGQGREPRS
jgi:hypothetical protein